MPSAAAKSDPKLTIIQEPPVFLNLAASVDRAVQRIGALARAGTDIVVFGESWLPGYPVWLDSAPEAAFWDHAGAKALFRVLSENSVTAGDAHLTALQQASDAHDMIIVMGAHERDGGTLYNTTFTFLPGAEAPTLHRKLTPTYTERLIWGVGDGSTLRAAETRFGVLGGLICWEHWMPEARAAMHAQHETIHTAQWPWVKEMHALASRTYAFEGRCFVAAAGTWLTKNDVLTGFDSLGADAPAARDLLAAMPGDDGTTILEGGSAIIGPDGFYLAGPGTESADAVSATLPLAALREGNLTLDVAGHYSRPDIFQLTVNTEPRPGVLFSKSEAPNDGAS